jgi:hypothetical protein
MTSSPTPPAPSSASTGRLMLIRPSSTARARLVAAGADPDDLVDIEVLLEHTPLGEVPMVYELRTSGMACGPVSHRLWVGFDLA